MTPKPVQTTEDPAVAWAEKLWKRLETGFLEQEKTIIAIIETRAWETLGYESFAKAWVDRLGHIRLVSELFPHIVYQMFSEGLSVDQVADEVKGVTPEIAQELKRQQDNGIPADEATTVVRKHNRRKPGEWSFLKLGPVDPDVLKEWHRRARANKVIVAEYALDAVVKAFDELED